MRAIITGILCASASLAAADPRGFTIEVHAGAGVLAAGSDYGSRTDPAPLSAQAAAGGFVNDRLALTGQVIMTTAIRGIEGQGSETYTTTQIGPAVQVWLAPFLWVGAGGGLATVSYMNESVSAIGVNARAGFALPQRGHNSWSVTVGGTTTLLADHDWVTGSIQLGYQYL